MAILAILLLLYCLAAPGWFMQHRFRCNVENRLWINEPVARHEYVAETELEAATSSMQLGRMPTQHHTARVLIVAANRLRRHQVRQLPWIGFNITVEQLLLTYDSRSWFNIADYMATVQESQKCDSAEYLLVDDITTSSGMGWSLLTMVPLALQALVSKRILVHASSVVKDIRWSWCNEPPFSPECYFRHWTPCLDYLREQQLTIQDLQGMPNWNHFDSYSNSTKYIAFKQVHQVQDLPGSRDAPFYWAEPWFASPSLRSSRFYWYGLFMQQYFSPSIPMEVRATEFLRSNGVSYTDRFIVANVRHGSKVVEQTPISPERFIDPLKSLMACLKTNHVFMVTETASVAQRMFELARLNGIHLITVNYTYPNTDSWNKQLNPAAAANMTEIGEVSALVLAITQRASAFVGTLQSAW
jgi:hypothetical protein